MKKMAVGKFKARCLAVMEEARATGEPVVVTKRGTPVVKVVPVNSEREEVLGFMAGEFRITGDIESPLQAWQAAKE